MVTFFIIATEFGKQVSVKVTTSNIRIKLVEEKTILYEFPVLRVTYCGLDKTHKEAVSFVAKECKLVHVLGILDVYFIERYNVIVYIDWKLYSLYIETYFIQCNTPLVLMIMHPLMGFVYIAQLTWEHTPTAKKYFQTPNVYIYIQHKTPCCSTK